MGKTSTSGQGRKPGVLNKTTSEFKQVVTDLLDQNKENVSRWLNMVANGDGESLKPDPGKALDLMSRLAEYAYPKLARTELTGPNGGPQEVIFKTVYDKS